MGPKGAIALADALRTNTALTGIGWVVCMERRREREGEREGGREGGRERGREGERGRGRNNVIGGK